MMQILAHRGLWKTENEKNSFLSISKAFKEGFGIETDIRDYCGKLVVSHDIADEKSITLESVFEEYIQYGGNSVIALNVKADGIQKLLMPLLEKYKVNNYFLFDMSIPEMVVNSEKMLKCYTRNSDIEEKCVLYDIAEGVWLDYFYNRKWLTNIIVEEHLKNNKKVCIVSPELHGYEYRFIWEMLKINSYHKNEFIALCTDKPDEARRYFYE